MGAHELTPVTGAANPIGGVAFSFEFFPPKSPAKAKMLRDTADRLCRFQPRFLSVTYGTGRSSREATLATLVEIAQLTGLPLAGHLTCVGASRRSVDAVAESYWESGIRHVVALRGDPPTGAKAYRPHPKGYRGAADLVSGLLRIADFEISVAGYPEVHSDSPSRSSDLENLKRKLDAGASRVITQFCFDSDRILRFIESARAIGIEAPVAVGILPVGNFEKAEQFSGRCGASIPGWMRQVFAGGRLKSPRMPRIAESIAVEQCVYLRANGIRDFHFYTLNRADLTGTVCRFLRMHPAVGDPPRSPSGAVG